MSLVYTTLASDTFQRANENPLNPLVWGTSDGIAPLQILNNEVMPTSAESIGIYTGIAWPNNQWAQCQVDACKFVSDVNQDFASVIVVGRRQNAINGYAWEIDGPLGSACHVIFFVLAAGVGTTFFDGFITVNAGSIIRLECFGSQISAFTDGVLISSVTDTTFTSGQMAIDLFETFTSPAVTDAQFKNFSGGLISQAVPAGPGLPVEQHYMLTSIQKDQNNKLQGNTVTSSVVNTIDDITQQIAGASAGTSTVPPAKPPLLKNMPPYFIMKNPA